MELTNSVIAEFSSAPIDSTTSRGVKRPSSFITWLTASPSKPAQQNSPVETSQNETPAWPLLRYTAEM